ncbi:MAG: Sec-independent protein translocase TatB [Pseudolysinimonas sp.]
MSFGLTFDKLLFIAFIALMLIGPQRLPHYASRLAVLAKRVRGFLDDTKGRVDSSLSDEEGESIDWRRLDPRQYDPRKIIREAWEEADPAKPTSQGPNKDAAAIEKPTQ